MNLPQANIYRDHWCGLITTEQVDQTIRLAGWVHRRRDHGGLVFIDLRDRSGLIQLVFRPEAIAQELHQQVHRLRAEDVLSVVGKVVRRMPETVNAKLPTGEVEVVVSDFKLLADAKTPPFPIDDPELELDELTRLRHRVLDLRRQPLQEKLLLRHQIIVAARECLNSEGFIEMETPFLTRSTPEGARDFLVPARNQRGSFYALPQSPQLFK